MRTALLVMTGVVIGAATLAEALPHHTTGRELTNANGTEPPGPVQTDALHRVNHLVSDLRREQEDDPDAFAANYSERRSHFQGLVRYRDHHVVILYSGLSFGKRIECDFGPETNQSLGLEQEVIASGRFADLTRRGVTTTVRLDDCRLETPTP